MPKKGEQPEGSIKKAVALTAAAVLINVVTDFLDNQVAKDRELQKLAKEIPQKYSEK